MINHTLFDAAECAADLAIDARLDGDMASFAHWIVESERFEAEARTITDALGARRIRQ